EHHRYTVSALDAALDEIHRRIQFDVVNLEFPYLAHHRPSRAASGRAPPPLLIDAHEIAYDMVRQFGRTGGVGRKVYSALNWRKLRSEERTAFRSASGVYVCSLADRDRVLAEVPGTRTAVVPNAADVEFYRPAAPGAAGDGRTVLFFGLLSTLPNIDGVLWFTREVWPRIAAAHPAARLKILGKGAPPAVQALSGPGIEVVGFVEDLRPELAAAAVLVVPLRLGGGTRLKIVEGMAMGKAIVSTALGAEGIEAVPGEQLLIADEPASFAASVLGLLADPALARRIGASARRLAEDRYSWNAAAAVLDGFLREVVEARE
ncbi:MAG TPA: glycosyltransferase family 4 protein, partial [Myxococcaceae bacterium]